MLKEIYKSLLLVPVTALVLPGCDTSTAYDNTAKPLSALTRIGDRFKLPDGSIYTGDFHDGVFHGEGTLVWENGEVYRGGFANGLFHGKGVFELSSGEPYEGEMANGMLDGQGKLESVQGAVYVGEFRQNNYHGRGHFTQSNGDTYEGDFIKGQFTGKGKIIYGENGLYQGEVKDWEMHGQGRYLDKQDSTVYEGTFVNGVLEGKGKITSKLGNVYVGHVSGWKADGQGELKRLNGEHYIGEFKNNEYHGQGKLTYRSRDSYEGGFEYGMRSGIGTLVRANPKGRKKIVKGWWQYDEYVGDKKPTQNAARKKSKPVKVDAEGIFYSQSDLLTRKLNKIKASTPSIPDVYMINFAAYGSQDVFMKEAQFADQLFTEKFGARGRTINLINNHKLVKDVPLASVTNLERSLEYISQQMDNEEDILFLFLTSHGSKNELSVSMKGMPLNDLSASKLSAMLDKSGIKWKVIVVSACYSGSFIDELKDDYTMIMTASRADHVSFGCSDEAEFTFFGRAFFKNAVNESASFKEAFEKARTYVSQWEDKEKYDHSEPQIWTTKAIEQKLALWRKTIH